MACAVFGAVALVPAAAATTGQSPTITLQAARPRLRSGTSDLIAGQVTNASRLDRVRIYSRPFPYKTAKLIRTLTPGEDGSFSFRVSPHRNTRYGAILTGTPARAAITLGVFGQLQIKVRALPLGRAGIRLVVGHPRGLPWGDAVARWYVKTPTHHHFYEVRSTHTRRLSPTAIGIHTATELPPGKFLWRVCFHAPQDQAILNTKRPPGCTGRGYHGTGRLPEGYPGPGAVARAISFESHRTGRTSFAVMDSEGRISGRNVNATFMSASVVKAMLLVAYLRLKQARGQHTITPYDRSILNPMIEVSDNDAATRCQSIVGVAGLYEVARAAHMTHFSVPTGFWLYSRIAAADQARFFFIMDSIIPHEFVGYANYLLSHIVSYESWGIPAVARPRGYRVWFKGGWWFAPPYVTNQVARLEGHGKRFAIAVMTQGDRSFADGINTIQGVTSKLLG